MPQQKKTLGPAINRGQNHIVPGKNKTQMESKYPVAISVHCSPILQQIKNNLPTHRPATVAPTMIQRQTNRFGPPLPQRTKSLPPPVYRPQSLLDNSKPVKAKTNPEKPGIGNVARGYPPVGPPSISMKPMARMPGPPPVYRPQPSPARMPENVRQTIPKIWPTTITAPNCGRPVTSPPTAQLMSKAKAIKRGHQYGPKSWPSSPLRQGVTIQPSCCGCWSGISSFFANLFSSSQTSSSTTSTPSFGVNYGVSDIKSKIVDYQRLSDKDEDWLSETTCSTTAKNVTRSFAPGGSQGSGISKGGDCGSLETFMTQKGKSASNGVIIRVKLGQSGLSQHEFAIEQVGNECFLIQSWLKKLTLNDWLSRAQKKTISQVLSDLKQVESAFEKKDQKLIGAAIKTTFDVDEEEEILQLWSGYTMGITWEAWNRE